MTSTLNGSPAPSSGKHSLARRLLAALLLILCLLALAIGLTLYTAHSERGTQMLWKMAVSTLRHSLSGQIEGSLAYGLRLKNVTYQDRKLAVSIDTLNSRWQFQRSPARFVIAYIDAGTVQVRLTPAPPSPPAGLPRQLTLPLAMQLNRLSLKKLTVRKEAFQTDIQNLLLTAESNRTQHQLVLKQVETQWGKATAFLNLNGLPPFKVDGRADLTGDYQNEHYQLDSQLSGHLEALSIRLNTRGTKLSGYVDVQATPFAPVPLKHADLAITHFNPRAFSPSAPLADLTLKASLTPAQNYISPSLNGKNEPVQVVSGPVTLVNAQPGPLDKDRLPLISATAQLRLAENTQQLSHLMLKLIHTATIEGHGEVHTILPSTPTSLPANTTLAAQSRAPATATATDKAAAGSASAASVLRQGSFEFDVSRLDLNALHTGLKRSELSGPLKIRLNNTTQTVSLKLADALFRIQAEAELNPETIRLHQVQFGAGTAQLDLKGQLNRDTQAAFKVEGKLAQFNPATWTTASPLQTAPPSGKKTARSQPASSASAIAPGRINADFEATGMLLPPGSIKLKFGIHDSEYDRLPMTGNGLIDIAGQRLLPSQANLSIAGNQVMLKGSFGTRQDKLNFSIQAPALHRLGFGLEGAVQAQGYLAGTLANPIIDATGQAEKLVFGVHRLDKLSVQAHLQSPLNNARPAGMAAPFPEFAHTEVDVTLNALGYSHPELAVNTLNTHLKGTYGRHQLETRINGQTQGKPVALTVAAQGALHAQQGKYAWEGTINTLENKGMPRFALTSPLKVSAAANRIILGAARMTIVEALIDLKSFHYEAGQLRSEGTASSLNIGHLLELQHEFTGTAPPFKSNLVIDGNWNFALGTSASGFLTLQRRQGDIHINRGRGTVALGLSDLLLRADFQSNRLHVNTRIAATRIGTLNADGDIALQPTQTGLIVTPDAPISGQATLAMPQIKTMGALIDPNISFDGRMNMNLKAGGTLANPKLSGAITGDELKILVYDQGLRLSDGTLRLGLTENVVELHKMEFRGGNGTLQAQGRVQLDQSNPDLKATITADRFQLFADPSRQLVLSGQATFANIQEKFQVNGKFTVNHALFDLPKSSAPSLSDDVVILHPNNRNQAINLKGRSNRQKPVSRFSPHMTLEVDLGEQFQFKGADADLLLRGTMIVRSEPGLPLQASGTIRARGTYEVFGRKLLVERGRLNFQGPLDNPNLNIRAMRRNQDVEAGIQITGNARSMRVELISEPNVGDEEKLSWLMFGHGTSDNTALGRQQVAGAALALLNQQGGKRLAQGLGLDELSIAESESGLETQHVARLGKTISDRFYIGYEQSLNGAESIVRVTWQLTNRWSMVVRAGTINSLDVLFSRRFD